MMQRRLVISFSGGETSAYMTYLMLTKYRHLYDVIIILFANTSQESDETLEFVDLCDNLLFKPLGVSVTYLEAVQFHGLRNRAGFRIVSFQTACRDGSVFEDMIRKYGIPNQKFSHCTRDLKLAPIRSFTNALGWVKGSFDTAIGIRSDEIDRMSVDAFENRIIYPLASAAFQPTTKPQINSWFAGKPFRLRLKGYQGNCKWCWKKSKRKLFTLIKETPLIFEFPRRMEAIYSYVGPEFQKSVDEFIEYIGKGYRRTFFRGGKTVDQLFADYELVKNEFIPAEDDAIIFDPEFDTGGGCGDSESCEVFSDETLHEFEEPE